MRNCGAANSKPEESSPKRASLAKAGVAIATKRRVAKLQRTNVRCILVKKIDMMGIAIN